MIAAFSISLGIGDSKGIIHFEHLLKNGSLLSIYKFNPAKFRFEAAYSNPPKTVNQFSQEKQEAIFTVNGGYWDRDYKPTDLLVVNGKTIKKPNYKNSHYGLFYVKSKTGHLRDLRYKPLGKRERFKHAIKCGPTCVLPGGKPNYIKSISKHARNIIGVDKKGYIFFVLNKSGRMTYKEATDFLVSDKIDAFYAFNLDGGGSVGFVYKEKGKVVDQRRSKKVNSVIYIIRK